MAHQIVATSAARGLDGVSGYQTVLKSGGIPPRVFDRLKARSGYSHRYPHGDSRNPVVYVHRIEELAGNRWHVLGCIRDAGSDHTGRSNFLAHMLAIDAAEARGKPGGPAAAALARGCFLDKWDRPPEPAAPAKTLVVSDRPTRPGDMPAWRAAGLDPGLAGDLAAAAMESRKVVIVTRPSDEVLALFADALRMVEPSKRWGVTFNTCAIEDFDGIWKAVRADLVDAKDLRDGKTSLIDLTANPRGSDDPYAKFARGDIDSLPWQKLIADVEAPEPEEVTIDDTDPVSEGRGEQPARKARKQKPKQKNATADKAGKRERRPRYEEEQPAPGPWRGLAIASLGVLLVGALAAIPFRDQIIALVRPSEARHVKPSLEMGGGTVTPPPTDARDSREYRAATKLKEARARLERGVDGKTHDGLRDEADKLLTRIQDLRAGRGGSPALQIMAKDGAGRDPSRHVKGVIEVCDHVAEIVATANGLKLEDVEKAESELRKAVDRLEVLREEVKKLEADERAHLDAKRVAEEAEALRQRQQQAFEALQSIVNTVTLPTANEADGADLGAPRQEPGLPISHDLGEFFVADLVEPKFRLAVPCEKIDGQAFKADIVRLEGEGDPRWEIRYVPTAVDLAGGNEARKRRLLAALVARQGRLVLEVPRSNELRLSPFALLRRSVLLMEAKDPGPPEAPAVVREIRLVEPTKVRPLTIDLFAEDQQELKIKPPNGIPRPARGPDGGTLNLPIDSVRFEADLPKGTKVNVELPKDVKEGTDPGIGKWDIPLVELSKELAIQAIVKLSLPQATMTVQTEFVGPRAKLYAKEDVKKFFIDKPDDVLRNLRRGFDNRVKTGADFEFDDGKTSQGGKRILAWFSAPLASEQKGGMVMPMPDHETVGKSFDTFLGERYAEAAKGMKEGQRPDLPANFGEFFERCKQVKDNAEWQKVFTNRIAAWSHWFWPKFEAQWHECVKMFAGALKERHEIRIGRITSLAYDESGKVYEVPLVVLDNQPPSVSPARPSTSENAAPSVGID